MKTKAFNLLTRFLLCFAVLHFCEISMRDAYAGGPSQAGIQEKAANLQMASANARYRNPNMPTRWWESISTKPDSWYRSAEGLGMAENILSWQDNGTGWPLMNTTRERFTGDSSRAGPWGTKAALIKATVNEIRFMARAYRATKDERFRSAMIGGLTFILDAQHPSGGWPHSYPLRMDDYSHYATFNDDEMADLMALLQEVISAPEFAPVGADNKTRAKTAFDRGVEFILKSQVVANGRLTVWCQQHDEMTYAPRPARAFEPAALSGAESAGVLELLMSIRKPSPQVVKAIEAGVQWYRETKIEGLEVVRKDGDCLVRSNPTAPTLWARFYEIGANRPIFAGRDGAIKYSLAEVEKERRGGYAWYSTSGTRVFARHESWKHAQKWATQPPTNIDESLVGTYTLPDILSLEDGKRVSSPVEWEQLRRPQILRLFSEHQHGKTPDTILKPKIHIVEQDAAGLGGLSRRTQARLSFSDAPEAPVIRVLLHTPVDAQRPAPTLLYLSFSPNVLTVDEPGVDEGMAWSATLKARIPDRDAINLGKFDVASFVRRGYGVALVYYGDIEPDFDHQSAYGVRSLFSKSTEKRRPDEWGAIGAWAWGLSRVMDYLQVEPRVDAKRVALAGVSRLGKTALWAAAQDQRFALVIPLLSGEGGAALSRRNYGETIADLTNPARYHYWYAPRYAEYAFNVHGLPVDGHMLLALIAPRPILQIVGSEDTWSDPMGEFLAAKQAESVYALYSKSGLGVETCPAPENPILNDMGFFMHKGKHTTLPVDFKVMADFMDKHLR